MSVLTNEKPTLTMKGTVDDILKMAYGGKTPGEGGGDKDDDAMLASGGKAEGPSHEEGGIDAVDQSGQPVAEIEGGERVFSKEDTAALEQSAEQIIQLQESGDKAGAEDMAMRLGFAVVNMIAAQEKNQADQEQQMSSRAQSAPGAPSAGEAEAMNQFTSEPQ